MTGVNFLIYYISDSTNLDSVANTKSHTECIKCGIRTDSILL